MNGAFRFVFAGDHDVAVLLRQGHTARQVILHRTLRSFDRHGIAVHGKSDAFRHWNRLLPNSRHTVLHTETFAVPGFRPSSLDSGSSARIAPFAMLSVAIPRLQ